MNKIKLEAFELLTLNEIENHRVDGELFIQYKIQSMDISESCRIRIVLHRSDKTMPPFKNLTFKKLEVLLKEEFFSLISLVQSQESTNR